MKGNLEDMLLQCPKPTLQQISHTAQQLRLEKAVCGRSVVRQKGKQSSSDYSQQEDSEAAAPLSQENQYSFLWHQGPILVPQAMGATLTSPRCTPQALSLRVKPFCLPPLWALPCIQSEVPALPRNGDQKKGESQGKKT